MDSAIKMLTLMLAPETVIVIKSIVPIGTSTIIARRLEANLIRVALNPEFLSEGIALCDF